MKTINLLILLFVIYSCSDEILQPGINDFYYSSFENEKDTIDWTGLTGANFSNEACPGGGGKSVIIGGGCIQPAATLKLGTAPADGKLKMSFQAKMLQESQSAGLFLLKYSGNEIIDSIAATVNSIDWSSYESSSILNVSEGDSLRIDFFVGGFVLAEVMLDQLRVYYVK
ncbi:MAG: hypothetical protein V1720_14905 [bacterium]